MPVGILFWVLMLLWLVFGLYPFVVAEPNPRLVRGGNLLIFILFAVLGWQVFGAAVK